MTAIGFLFSQPTFKEKCQCSSAVPCILCTISPCAKWEHFKYSYLNVWRNIATTAHENAHRREQALTSIIKVRKPPAHDFSEVLLKYKLSNYWLFHSIILNNRNERKCANLLELDGRREWRSSFTLSKNKISHRIHWNGATANTCSQDNWTWAALQLIVDQLNTVCWILLPKHVNLLQPTYPKIAQLPCV